MEAFRGNFNDFDTTLNLNSIFRGVVEDTDDPECRGRARIRIFGIHTPKIEQDENEGVPTEHLPWAEQVAPLLGGNSGFGSFSVPLRGSVVFCFFEQGDPMQIRYFGVMMGKTAEVNQQSSNPSGTGGSSGKKEGSPKVGSGGNATPMKAPENVQNLCDAAKDLKADPCTVYAISQIESGGGSGLVKTPDGKVEPLMVYERHKWMEYASKEALAATKHDPRLVGAYVPRQSSTAFIRKGAQAEAKRRFEETYALDPKAAVAAVSWGKYQVMPIEMFKRGMYTPESFLEAVNDPNRQEELFVAHLRTKGSGMANAIQSNDWHEIARRYNGRDYKSNNYHSKMENKYNECKRGNKVDCSKKG